MSGMFKRGALILPGAPKPDDMLVRHPHHLAPVIRNQGTQDNLSLSSRMDDTVRSIEQIFPDICPRLVTAVLQVNLMNSNLFELAVQNTVDHFLQVGFFRKSSSSSGEGASTSNAREAAVVVVANGDEHLAGKELVDLTTSDSEEAGEGLEEFADAQLYEEWCLFRLSLDFPRIGLPSLKTALKLFQGKLDRTYIAVNLQYQRVAKKKNSECPDVDVVADQTLHDVSWLPKGRLRLLKNERPPRRAPDTECPRYESDWKALHSGFPNSEGLGLHELSSTAEEEPAPPEGIDCGCCYAESLFEELVQCADGHLFCTQCLRRHLEGYIFGGSQQCGLPLCLDTNGCDKSFPWSEVKRALPLDVLSKYEQRQAEDAVARAQLEGLVYCPFCNHPWEVDPGMAVLRCHNEVCKKASCIKCKEPDHLPQRCDEVEKKSETSKRRKVEELMTRALIRECTSCKAELVKIEGCNKITCRCGTAMCYVCRKPISSYSHFCQHVREPGVPCKQCAGCSLWEKENEAEVVEAAKKAAIEEVGAEDPDLLKRDIGPSELGKPFKKPRGTMDGRVYHDRVWL